MGINKFYLKLAVFYQTAQNQAKHLFQMIPQVTMLIIEIFSNRLIILKEQNNLYRPISWHKDCIIEKRRYVILLTIGKNYYSIYKKGRIEISGGTSF